MSTPLKAQLLESISFNPKHTIFDTSKKNNFIDIEFKNNFIIIHINKNDIKIDKCFTYSDMDKLSYFLKAHKKDMSSYL